MHKFARVSFKIFDLLIIFMMVFGSPMSVLAAPSPTGATIASDKADYSAGATVTLTGTGWATGESVHIVVNDTIGQTWKRDVTVTADNSGNLTDVFSLPSYFVSDYDVTASGPVSGDATATFTDAPASVNLDQCRNGSATSPNDCKDLGGNTGWVNGNVGASQAHMLEGYSTPFRAVMTNLPTGTPIQLVIGYDIRNSGANAYDYITQYQRLDPHSYFGHPAETVFPTDGVTGFSAITSTFPIPAPSSAGSPVAGQPTASFNSLPAAERVMTLFGGTISAMAYVSQGSLTASQSETQISVTFTADNPTAVLAWGGHISQCSVWGTTNGTCNSAGGISGSPYHMRLASWCQLDANGVCIDKSLPNLGNTDKSMAAAVVVQPGNLTLAKSLTGGPNGYTGPFTIDYSCTDGTTGSVTVNAGGSQTVNGIASGSVCTISETPPTAPSGYTFGTPTFSPSSTVTIGAGTTVTVTTNNTLTQDQGYLKITKSFDAKTSGFNGTFDIVYNCGAGDVTVSLSAGGSTTVGPFNTGTSCTVSEPTLPTAPNDWTFGTPSVSGSPATIVKGDQSAAVVVTVTNSISRDQGYLKITKSFDAKTSGFNGTFDIVYNCGAGDQTVSLAAGGSTTVGPFDTGTSCTVSEPILPTAPTGWTFGTPSVSGSPATIVKGDQASAVVVTVTNSITRDLGSLILAKILTGGPAGYTGPFTIHWDCGSFGSGDETVSAGGSATISNIPTGTSCTVSEAPPTAPTGYSFGTPTFSPSDTVTIPAGNGSSVTVTTNNTLSRDLGSLVLAKSLDDGGSGFTGPFTIHWDCGSFGSGDESVSAGGSATVSNIPTGTSCTVSEPNLPSVTGYSFGTPTFSPSDTVTIPAGNGSSVTVTTNNTMTRDLGSLKISKTLSNPDGANVPASFTVNYSCDDGTSGSATVAPGSPATVNGIPTGSTCTVTEVAPVAIPGYTWGTITYSPASVTIDTKGQTFTITVGNSITRDRGSLTIVKKVVNDNGGTATVSAFGINTSAGSLTFDSGVANGTTTTYTSQKMTVVTGTYTLKENDVYGYTEGTWSCTGAAGTVVPTFNNGSVQVGKDEDVTCTITNNDQPGTIIIIKNAKPAQGSFAFTTTGTGYNGFTLTGATANNGNKNTQTLNAGTYTVKESTQLGWILTGVGGSTDPNTPYNCVVTGSGGSSGVAELDANNELTGLATIILKNGDTVTCTYENTGQGVTRTQGFWATHPQLANIAWFGGTAFGHTFPGVANTAGIGDTLLCGRSIDTLGKLMGGFWSDVSKTSTGTKRSALDQARMQLLQQLLAAELNASAFGSVPSNGSFTAWESAYCTGNQTQIKNALQQAASFNTAGDSGTFTPGTSADSKTARSIANRAFWDTLP